MRISSDEELVEYHKRLDSIIYQPITEEVSGDIHNFLKRMFPNESHENILESFNEVIKLYPSPNWTYRNRELSNVERIDDIDSIRDKNTFESLWEDGDYLFYYFENSGLAGRGGWILIDGKTFLRKHHYWEWIS